jgi:DICT domain-containing protein
MGISLYRSIAQQYEQICAVNTVPMMNAISKAIEDQVIAHKLPVEFYAGFQRFSRFPHQLRRYERLGDVCRRVYIFGVADAAPPRIPGIEYVELHPDDDLAREWFLLVDAPELWTALTTREEPGRDLATGGRRFAGLWSFDSQVTERLALLISQHLGRGYRPLRSRDSAAQMSHVAEMSGALLSRLERRRLSELRAQARARALQQFAGAAARHSNGAQIGAVPLFLLRELVQTLTSQFGASDVAVAYASAAEGEFHIVATDDHTAPTSYVLRRGDGPSGRAISEGRLVTVADLPRSGERDPLLPGAAALLAAPIVGRRRTYGVITVSGATTQLWEPGDGQALMALADILAMAVERDPAEPAVRPDPEYARRLAATIVRLREPVGRVASAQDRLAAAGPLTPAQQAVLAEHRRALDEISRAIGVVRAREVGA